MQFTPPDNESRDGWYERLKNYEVQKRDLVIKSKHYESSDRLRIQSQWDHISKAILHASGNKKLNIAASIESNENFEIKYEYLKKFFTSGNKYSHERVKEELIKDYMKRLKHKEVKKEKL